MGRVGSNCQLETRQAKGNKWITSCEHRTGDQCPRWQWWQHGQSVCVEVLQWRLIILNKRWVLISQRLWSILPQSVREGDWIRVHTTVKSSHKFRVHQWPVCCECGFMRETFGKKKITKAEPVCPEKGMFLLTRQLVALQNNCLHIL